MKKQIYLWLPLVFTTMVVVVMAFNFGYDPVLGWFSYAQEIDQVKEQIFKEAKDALQRARDEGVPLLSPNNFAKAKEFYQKALEDYEKGESLKRIRENLGQAMQMLSAGFETAKLARVALEELIRIREDVATMEVHKYALKDHAKAEKKFEEAILKVEEGNLKEAKSIAKVAEKNYRKAVVLSLEKGPLAEVIDQIKRQQEAISEDDYRKAMSELTGMKEFLKEQQKSEFDVLELSQTVNSKVQNLLALVKPPLAAFPQLSVLTKKYSDRDELATPNEKDFQCITLSIVGGNLHADITFYEKMNLAEFFYYFSTDTDPAAEICVRCWPNIFEVAKETQSGWYNTVIYKGTPTVMGKQYSLELPWATIFKSLDTIKLWLYSMDGGDKLPDTGDVSVSWWPLVSCSKKEQTLYQSIVDYKLTPAGWWMRCKGEVDNRSHLFFPKTTVQTPEVSKLLAAIGSPTMLTWDDSEIWKRVVKVWTWLQNNQLFKTDANYIKAENYIASLGHWPSLAEIAYMYVSYGGIYWGTCMSRAQLFATLLYAVGVPPDRFAIAEAYWKPAYSQHMYIILYLNNHWIYLDPMDIGQILSNLSVSSVGKGTADYVHPLRIVLLPGSKLAGVPLVM
jgi:hypothetical protein